MKKEDIQEILAEHLQWVNGTGGKLANFEEADLTDADLIDANLKGANLKGANFEFADLTGANLKYANLRGASFKYANLTYASLKYADLTGADLTYANLTDADLIGASITDADLTGAVLRGAFLVDADLTGANLKNVNLSYTSLRRANLVGANLDSSGLSLWSGIFDMTVDKRIFTQFAYHLCRLNVDDPVCKRTQVSLKNIANQFHRIGESENHIIEYPLTHPKGVTTMKKSINGLIYDEDKMTSLVFRDATRNGLYAGTDSICKTPGGNYAVLTSTNGQDFSRHNDILAISKDEIASYISGWSITDEEAATLIAEGILQDA